MEFQRRVPHPFNSNMMRYLQIIVFITCCLSVQAQEFRLAPPILRCDQVFFDKIATVRINFALNGAQIRYTLDGSAPSKTSPIYRKPLKIKQDAMVKAIAMHLDYQTSTIAILSVFKKGIAFKTTPQLKEIPAPEYAGSKAPGLVLTDGKAGSEDLKDGNWLGFKTDLGFQGSWEKPQNLQSVKISSFTAWNSWILPPTRIEVWGALTPGSWQLLVSKAYDQAIKPQEGRQLYALDFPLGQYRQIKVIVHNSGPLPENHPGKGNPAWLFVDEILFN